MTCLLLSIVLTLMDLRTKKKGGEKLFNHARSKFHKNAVENAKHIPTSQAVNVQLNIRLKHLQIFDDRDFFLIFAL